MKHILKPVLPLVLQEMAFRPPFHTYEGKNFVLWGNEDKLLAGDQIHGALAAS